MLIRSERSNLMIIDVQERLAPVMADPRRIIHGCGILLKAARRLGIPVTATEQYPQGIGPTMVDLRQWLSPDDILSKLSFSGADEPAILGRLVDSGRKQVVMAGVEAHVCILQTALGLREKGFEVFVVGDASGSRRAASEGSAWDRLRYAGIAVVTTEMVLFEWLRVAGTPEFKELIALIK